MVLEILEGGLSVVLGILAVLIFMIATAAILLIIVKVAASGSYALNLAVVLTLSVALLITSTQTEYWSDPGFRRVTVLGIVLFVLTSMWLLLNNRGTDRFQVD